MRGIRNLCKQITHRGFATATFSELPIIDVAPLVAAPSTVAASERYKVGKQLHQACRDVGFFYIRNGMDGAIAKDALIQAGRWFALPEAMKREILLRPESHYRGYQPLGVNVTQGARDWHEGIDLYKEISPEEAKTIPFSPIHGTNPWPIHIPAFDVALRRYITACLDLGAALMQGIAMGLNLPEDTFEGDRAGDPYWVARVIHYPPLSKAPVNENSSNLTPNTDPISLKKSLRDSEESSPESMSCGAHTDYGLLTIVNQDLNVTALQVMNGQSEWIDAPPLPGTFVCNIGDMLRIWTNGMYTPTLHRVVNKFQDRISIPFFYEPNFEAEVQPLPQLVTESGRPALPGVRYGEHLESKVLNNFQLEPETWQKSAAA